MGKKKIRAQLVGSIPQHLDAEKVKLDVLIRKISEELDPQKAIVSASGNVGQAEKQHGYAPLEKLVISSKPVPVLGLSPATAVPAAAAFKNLEKPAENPIPRNAKIAGEITSHTAYPNTKVCSGLG